MPYAWARDIPVTIIVIAAFVFVIRRRMAKRTS
jgi:hypothetical protein